MSFDNRKPGSFFDKNTIIAIGLSFAVFFFWQMYVSKKYPKNDPNQVVAGQTQGSPVHAGADGAAAAPGDPSTKDAANAALSQPKAVPAEATEQTVHYASEDIEFDISSIGMGIKNLKLKKFLDRKEQPISYASVGATALAATTVNGLQNYTITKISENEYQGVATDNNLTVTKLLTIEPQKYLIKVSLVAQSNEKQKIIANTLLSGEVLQEKKSFLLPSYEHQEFFVMADKNSRTVLSPDTAVKNEFLNVRVASFNSHYFALALVNRSPDMYPSSAEEVHQGLGSVLLKYETAQPVASQKFDYDFYFGPKDMDLLKSIDTELTPIIDYGFFSFIGKPLLWLLKALQTFFNNWGISIIVLTLILRVLLLPMNLYSFKAMKKMQKIQPKLKEIKEKFKADPQRANQETMLLMKTEKANPLSGCLPALAQIPIFFALYAVLGKSIELYKQPFFFWIQDLSLKDPFFILPILVGATFFIQQKVTPTTAMDPTQQKVLMFMPLIFSLFMLSTPSGLTLYMFVNGLFGVIQQIVFTKEKTT